MLDRVVEIGTLLLSVVDEKVTEGAAHHRAACERAVIATAV